MLSPEHWLNISIYRNIDLLLLEHVGVIGDYYYLELKAVRVIFPWEEKIKVKIFARRNVTTVCFSTRNNKFRLHRIINVVFLK